MLHTTFKLAKEAGACTGHYQHFARAVGGVRKYGQDTPIPLTLILEHNGLDDALWALWCVLPEEEAARNRLVCFLIADYAEHALHFFESQYPDDKRPRSAIEAIRRFARGEATIDELGNAAWAARNAAGAARDAEQEWQARRFKDVNEGVRIP
jgi:hypothetical protein